MPGSGCADVVFCIDSSASMRPCFDAVRQNLSAFLSGLRSANMTSWDLRFDFVSHRAWSTDRSTVFEHSSVYCPDLCSALYTSQGITAGQLFTTDLAAFTKSLSSLKAKGDEANFV